MSKQNLVDHFAGVAMGSLVEGMLNEGRNAQEVAEKAYDIAFEMLKERSRMMADSITFAKGDLVTANDSFLMVLKAEPNAYGQLALYDLAHTGQVFLFPWELAPLWEPEEGLKVNGVPLEAVYAGAKAALCDE